MRCSHVQECRNPCTSITRIRSYRHIYPCKYTYLHLYKQTYASTIFDSGSDQHMHLVVVCMVQCLLFEKQLKCTFAFTSFENIIRVQSSCNFKQGTISIHLHFPQAHAVSSEDPDSIGSSIGKLLSEWTSITGGCKPGSKACNPTPTLTVTLALILPSSLISHVTFIPSLIFTRTLTQSLEVKLCIKCNRNT